MGNFFLVVSNLFITAAFLYTAWKLSGLNDAVVIMMQRDCRADQIIQHVKNGLGVVNAEYEVISAKLSDVGSVCEASMLESSMGKTEFISEIDRRLGDGEDDVTRANIRRAVTMAADMMAEMTTAECIAFVRRLRNG